MPESFLVELLIVISAASGFALLFERLRLPSILGLLLAGVFLGPSGFKIFSNAGHVQEMAELGAALLMLTIGLEFSFARVRRLLKTAFLGGGLQLIVSVGISVLIAWKLNWTLYQGFILGAVITLSSTAIVVKHLVDRAELDTLHGRLAFAVLVFQDLAVPFLLVLITGIGDNSGATVGPELIKAALKAFGLFAGVFAAAKFLIFPLLCLAAKTRNRELLFLVSMSICLGISCAGEATGLSFAIGAFLAGLVIANTDFGFQFMGELQPLRHLFVSIFFVSIGLLFDLSFALQHAALLALLVALVLFLNAVVMTGVAMALGYSPRVAMASGLLLCQIGEFSFVLLQAAQNTGGISRDFYQLVIGVAFITLFLSPLLFSFIPKLMMATERNRFLGLQPQQPRQDEELKKISEHVIVCGYGAVGRDSVGVLQQESIPFVLVEMNPALLSQARIKKIPVIAGDCANLEVLKRAGIMKAKAVVISFGDSLGAAQTLAAIRSLNIEISVLLRTRYESEIAAFYEKGADFVILEEWEASFQLNQNLLKILEIAPDRLEQNLRKIRERQELLSEELILKRFN